MKLITVLITLLAIKINRIENWLQNEKWNYKKYEISNSHTQREREKKENIDHNKRPTETRSE